jgi:poly(hydroxyalkanoate) depolymerase family esterase
LTFLSQLVEDPLMSRNCAKLGALLAATIGMVAAFPARAASLQQVSASTWTGGVANLPSDVLMYVYVPDKVATNPPILTLIHSCDSNASVVLGQAPDLKSAADKYGFIMVVPQSNPSSLRCWTTDSTQVWTRDKGGDSNAIKQMVVYALSKYQANADRVYAAGCSSGAMMTELLLGLYPDIFKAGASFAGMPAGCHGPNDNSSNATGYNGSCAGGNVNYTAQQWGDLVRAMDPGYAGHRPRLQLFHGDADSLISFKNMGYSEQQYINLLSLSTTATKTNTGLTLGTHQATEQQWNNACGYLVLDAFDSINGDHGPSDTLFVGKYVLPFFGLDSQTAVTAAVDPEVSQCAGDGGTPTSDGGTDASKTDSGSGGSGGSGSGGTTGAGGSGGSGSGGSTVSTGGSNATGGRTGSGGTSSAGGASGTGGSQASGGSATGGNTNGSGGGPGSGGAVGSGGSSASGGSAGNGSGGASSNGGAGGSSSTGGGGSSGCGCALGGQSKSHAYVDTAFAALGLALAVFVRRRRRAA